MKLVKIFVEKRTLQEEITMKNKLKKALCLGLVLTMFSTTSVMAATYGYSFGLMQPIKQKLEVQPMHLCMLRK